MRVGDRAAGGFETMFAEFFDDFTLRDEEFAGFEIGAGTRSIFLGFLRETREGIINPKAFRLGWCGFRLS